VNFWLASGKASCHAKIPCANLQLELKGDRLKQVHIKMDIQLAGIL